MCVTCDVWTCRATSFLGMTVHFLKPNFERKSYALAFRQLKGRQTHDILAIEMNKVIQDFGLKKEQISNIVTDGCAAFTKSFKVYGKEERLMSKNQTIEEIPFDDDDDDTAIAQLPFMQNEDGEMFVANILTFGSDELPTVIDNNDDDNESSENIQDDDDLFDGLISNDECENSDILGHEMNTIELPQQRRCVSHIANLLPNDFEKALPSAAKTAYIQAKSKLHALWVFVHRSAHAKTLCKEYLGCVLDVPSVTRWNSEFDAVAKGCRDDIKPKINPLIERIKMEIKRAAHMQTLSSMDWAVLEQYITVMKPIAVTLDKLQGEADGSQGFIIPSLISMLYHINAVNGSNLLMVFKKTALDVIKKRFDRYLGVNNVNSDLVLASVTTPKFKVDFIQNVDTAFPSSLPITISNDVFPTIPIGGALEPPWFSP